MKRSRFYSYPHAGEIRERRGSDLKRIPSLVLWDFSTVKLQNPASPPKILAGISDIYPLANSGNLWYDIVKRSEKVKGESPWLTWQITLKPICGTTIIVT